VPDVVVYLKGAAASTTTAGRTAVMDQVDKRFVPHVLVVQTGTLVKFPNSDTIAHHVYSFSHPNHFKLPIYKGDAHPPVTFDDEGIVVLGCNIHDQMLGYIAVVDTPVFAKTDEAGVATLTTGEVTEGVVSIWSPRIRDDAQSLSVSLEEQPGRRQVAFRLSKKLRPPHDQDSEALAWSDY
jgi:plastocyanin